MLYPPLIYSLHLNSKSTLPFFLSLSPCYSPGIQAVVQCLFMPVFLLERHRKKHKEEPVIIIVGLLSCQFARQRDRSDLLAALGRKIKAVDLWSMLKQPAKRLCGKSGWNAWEKKKKRGQDPGKLGEDIFCPLPFLDSGGSLIVHILCL